MNKKKFKLSKPGIIIISIIGIAIIIAICFAVTNAIKKNNKPEVIITSDMLLNGFYGESDDNDKPPFGVQAAEATVSVDADILIYTDGPRIPVYMKENIAYLYSDNIESASGFAVFTSEETENVYGVKSYRNSGKEYLYDESYNTWYFKAADSPSPDLFGIKEHLENISLNPHNEGEDYVLTADVAGDYIMDDYMFFYFTDIDLAEVPMSVTYRFDEQSLNIKSIVIDAKDLSSKKTNDIALKTFSTRIDYSKLNTNIDIVLPEEVKTAVASDNMPSAMTEIHEVLSGKSSEAEKQRQEAEKELERQKAEEEARLAAEAEDSTESEEDPSTVEKTSHSFEIDGHIMSIDDYVDMTCSATDTSITYSNDTTKVYYGNSGISVDDEEAISKWIESYGNKEKNYDLNTARFPAAKGYIVDNAAADESEKYIYVLEDIGARTYMEIKITDSDMRLNSGNLANKYVIIMDNEE